MSARLVASPLVLPGPDELCRLLLGKSPDDVRPFFVWDHRATYRVRLGADEFVVKADTNEHGLSSEAEGHAHAAAHGIPVPELLAVEPGALAMRFVRGEQLRRDSPDDSWRAAAAVVEQIHVAPPIGRHGGGFTRPLEDELASAIQCGLHLASAERIRMVLLATPPPPRTTWVHGDLQPDHFLLNGSEVVAVLDWSDHGRADPLWDYAVLAFDDPTKLGLILDDPADERLRVHRTQRLLSELRWLSEHDMRDAAERALLELNAQ